MDVDFSIIEEDINMLADIYLLENIHQEILSENLKTKHAFRMIGNEQILMEGFNDILHNIGNYFKKMIEAIKNFFKKLLQIFDAHMMSIDKFVKKYRTELDSMKDVDFDIDGYEYTLNKPANMKPFEDIVNDYNSGLADAKSGKIDGLSVKEYVQRETNKYLTDENLDKIRGQVLGNDAMIPAEDFQEEVRKYYRNGEKESQSVHIDTAKFAKYVASAEEFVKLKKETAQTRDKIIVLLDKTEKFFDTKVGTIYVDKQRTINTRKVNISDNKFNTEDDEDRIGYSDSSMENIDRYVKFCYTKVKNISGICNTVVTERANAAKDQVKFTADVIRTALTKKSKKEGDDK